MKSDNVFHSRCTVRIFVARAGTQLLVIQHLRRHLRLPEIRDFLFWHPLGRAGFVDDFMRSVISGAGFTDTLDIRDLESFRPRTAGPVSWLFESVRRLRQDSSMLRGWMAQNCIEEQNVELWADEPVVFDVVFSRGLLRNAKHVKIPHCFNHEDHTVPLFKRHIELLWQDESVLKRYLFFPWQRWLSGADMRPARITYDRAYSFDLPSPWCATSIDVSGLISIDAFQDTYSTLPLSLKQEVEAILAPIKGGAKPLILLLLFNLTVVAPHAYQEAVLRIFRERILHLRNCSLAVKVHPSASGPEEAALIAWLIENIPAQVFPIVHGLNLEFMLPQLRPDYVWAGPCGALPIIKRLGAGKPIVLSEVANELARSESVNSWSPEWIDPFVKDFEVW